jgi:hypothetical protein
MKIRTFAKSRATVSTDAQTNRGTGYGENPDQAIFCHANRYGVAEPAWSLGC